MSIPALPCPAWDQQLWGRQAPQILFVFIPKGITCSAKWSRREFFSQFHGKRQDTARSEANIRVSKAEVPPQPEHTGIITPAEIWVFYPLDYNPPQSVSLRINTSVVLTLSSTAQRTEKAELFCLPTFPLNMCTLLCPRRVPGLTADLISHKNHSFQPR